MAGVGSKKAALSAEERVRCDADNDGVGETSATPAECTRGRGGAAAGLLFVFVVCCCCFFFFFFFVWASLFASATYLFQEYETLT